jgi:hypothetical protein
MSLHRRDETWHRRERIRRITVGGARSCREEMVVSYQKEHVVEMLRRTGFADAAAAATTELPEEIDLDDLQNWAAKHGITRDAIVSQMGGSS